MAGEERGPPGGTAALLEFVEEHQPALRFDFRHYFGLPLDELGRAISYGEGTDLVLELMREPRSHLSADIGNLRQASSLADIAAIIHAESYINAGRDPKNQPKPFELPKPWAEVAPNADVTPERRAELEAQLARRSAFAN